MDSQRRVKRYKLLAAFIEGARWGNPPRLFFALGRDRPNPIQSGEEETKGRRRLNCPEVQRKDSFVQHRKVKNRGDLRYATAAVRFNPGTLPYYFESSSITT